MKPTIIVNPNAGRKAGFRVNAYGPREVQAVLARHGVEADLWETVRRDHATELARQAAKEGRPLVVAAGGDGTVAEVAAGLVGSDAVLGVLPLGSVMNLARMLGVPRDLDEAAIAIKAGHVVRIDAGRATTAVGQRLFLEGAGVGVSAALFAYANQIDSGNWGTLRPLLTYLLRYRPRTMGVRLDGRRQRVRATMVTVSNGPLLGAAFPIAPDARLDDRRLTVRIFCALTKGELLAQLWSILRGTAVYRGGIVTRYARLVEVVGRRPLMVHADAHPLGTTPARFELLPGALSVVVPERPRAEPALLQVARPAPSIG